MQNKPNTTTGWRTLTILLKLMHFAIYATLYMQKVFYEKSKALYRMIYNLGLDMMGYCPLDDIEYLTRFFAEHTLSKLPKHVSIVINGVQEIDDKLLINLDGKPEGRLQMLNLEQLACLFCWLAVSRV